MAGVTVGPTEALLLVLDRFRDCDPSATFAAVADSAGGAARLTYGDLRHLADRLVADRDRANRASRDAADSRDLLDDLRAELEDLRERYAELAAERDELSVRLDGEAGGQAPPARRADRATATEGADEDALLLAAEARAVRGDGRRVPLAEAAERLGVDLDEGGAGPCRSST